MTAAVWWLRDSWEMSLRNLIHIKRTPELLLDVTLSPIMFVLLFSLVFGGAIPTLGFDYTSYMMAGIFVQTIAFAGIYTSVLLANDLKNGMIDRFRSLPMNQSSVLVGRTRDRPVPRTAGGGDHVGRRPARRLRPDRLDPGERCRGSAHAPLRLRPVVDRRGRRRTGANARSAPGHHLRGGLPAHLRQQRVRPDRHDARLAPVVRRTTAADAGHERGSRPHAARRARGTTSPRRWRGRSACWSSSSRSGSGSTTGARPSRTAAAAPDEGLGAVPTARVPARSATSAALVRVQPRALPHARVGLHVRWIRGGRDGRGDPSVRQDPRQQGRGPGPHTGLGQRRQLGGGR